MRDITLEDTFRHQFTTRAFGTGIPTVLAGTPVLSVLEENNAVPITAGVSVSVDQASVVGLNEATIVATAANGYESGKSYAIYISTGTVASVSVVGEVVGHFTIGASAAAVDLANGTDGLGALKTETALIVGDTNELQTDWADAGRLDTILDARMAETSINTTTGAVDNVTLVATTTTNTDMRGTDSALIDKAGFSLSTAGILAIWHQLTAAIVTAGSVGKLIKDFVTGDAFVRLGAPVGASVSADIAVIEGQTDDIGVAGAGLTDLGGMSAGMKAEVNAEVDTALATTTYGEPAQGVPGATVSLKDKIGFLYKAWRNRSNQTATTHQLFNDDATTVDHKATVSDDGTTAEKGEVVAGP